VTHAIVTFRDHFSRDAAAYREHRPRYPDALFAHLAGLAPRRELAWDCGCGNGQAAVGLAGHFRRVVATDASGAQIAEALPHERVTYRIESAYESSLPGSRVDLIAVAQAAHWFDHDRFHAEVRRVLRPQGIIAIWAYGLHHITPAVDEVIERLYHEVVGPYWPSERHARVDTRAAAAIPAHLVGGAALQDRHGARPARCHLG
jgi:SAM-dependent methyltransferase